MMENRSIFLKSFFTEPEKIGSITPGSQFLTQKMIKSLPWDDINSIVELGAGTGVCTDYMARHKKKNCPGSPFPLFPQQKRRPQAVYKKTTQSSPPDDTHQTGCFVNLLMRHYYITSPRDGHDDRNGRHSPKGGSNDMYSHACVTAAPVRAGPASYPFP